MRKFVCISLIISLLAPHNIYGAYSIDKMVDIKVEQSLKAEMPVPPVVPASFIKVVYKSFKQASRGLSNGSGRFMKVVKKSPYKNMDEFLAKSSSEMFVENYLVFKKIKKITQSDLHQALGWALYKEMLDLGIKLTNYKAAFIGWQMDGILTKLQEPGAIKAKHLYYLTKGPDEYEQAIKILKGYEKRNQNISLQELARRTKQAFRYQEQKLSTPKIKINSQSTSPNFAPKPTIRNLNNDGAAFLSDGYVPKNTTSFSDSHTKELTQKVEQLKQSVQEAKDIANKPVVSSSKDTEIIAKETKAEIEKYIKIEFEKLGKEKSAEIQNTYTQQKQVWTDLFSKAEKEINEEIKHIDGKTLSQYLQTIKELKELSHVISVAQVYKKLYPSELGAGDIVVNGQKFDLLRYRRELNESYGKLRKLKKENPDLQVSKDLEEAYNEGMETLDDSYNSIRKVWEKASGLRPWKTVEEEDLYLEKTTLPIKKKGLEDLIARKSKLDPKESIYENNNIVVIWDDASNIDLLESMGKNIKGFYYSEDALKYIKEHADEIDYVFADYTLDGSIVQGIDVAREINKINPKIACVLQKGDGVSENADQIRELGFIAGANSHEISNLTNKDLISKTKNYLKHVDARIQKLGIITDDIYEKQAQLVAKKQNVENFIAKHKKLDPEESIYENNNVVIIYDNWTVVNSYSKFEKTKAFFTSEEALKYIEKNKGNIDYVLVDYILEGSKIQGPDVAKKISKIDPNAHCFLQTDSDNPLSMSRHNITTHDLGFSGEIDFLEEDFFTNSTFISKLKNYLTEIDTQINELAEKTGHIPVAPKIKINTESKKPTLPNFAPKPTIRNLNNGGAAFLSDGAQLSSAEEARKIERIKKNILPKYTPSSITTHNADGSQVIEILNPKTGKPVKRYTYDADAHLIKEEDLKVGVKTPAIKTPAIMKQGISVIVRSLADKINVTLIKKSKVKNDINKLGEALIEIYNTDINPKDLFVKIGDEIFSFKVINNQFQSLLRRGNKVDDMIYKKLENLGYIKPNNKTVIASDNIEVTKIPKEIDIEFLKKEFPVEEILLNGFEGNKIFEYQNVFTKFRKNLHVEKEIALNKAIKKMQGENFYDNGKFYSKKSRSVSGSNDGHIREYRVYEGVNLRIYFDIIDDNTLMIYHIGNKNSSGGQNIDIATAIAKKTKLEKEFHKLKSSVVETSDVLPSSIFPPIKPEYVDINNPEEIFNFLKRTGVNLTTVEGKIANKLPDNLLPNHYNQAYDPNLNTYKFLGGENEGKVYEVIPKNGNDSYEIKLFKFEESAKDQQKIFSYLDNLISKNNIKGITVIKIIKRDENVLFFEKVNGKTVHDVMYQEDIIKKSLEEMLSYKKNINGLMTLILKPLSEIIPKSKLESYGGDFIPCFKYIYNGETLVFKSDNILMRTDGSNRGQLVIIDTN